MSDVVVDARQLAYPITGIGRYTAELLRRLIRDESRGWVLLSPRPVPAALRTALAGPTVRWVVGADTGIGRAEAWMQRMARHELQSRPDAVFLGLASSVPLFGPRAARTVLVAYDLTYLTVPHLTHPRDLVKGLAVNLPSLLRADRILPISAHVERQLHRLLRRTRGKTRVLPLGGTHIGLDPNPRRFDDRRGFLVVGAHRRKGLGAVLDAYELLPADVRAAHALVVVGRDIPDALRRRSDVIARVDAPDDELVQHYRQSLALVYVSGHEGLGLPVAEALSAGLPVIVVAGTPMAELAGEGGLVLPRARAAIIAAAMRRLAGDPDEWRRRALAAAAIGSGIGWDKVTEAVREEIQAGSR